MRVLICDITLEMANVMLMDLLEPIPEKDINQVKLSKSQSYFELKNGDRYYTIQCSDSSRGQKCDKIYIGKFVDEEIIQEVLIPMLVVSKLPREEQIIYF